MRHQAVCKKLGRTSAHKGAMLRNMVASLIKYDRIETTVPKAKELRRLADKMVTLAKRNTLHARRQAMSILQDHTALQKLFTTLVDRYKDRIGGYTRILRLGCRHGDAAPMAIIEYLTAELKKAVAGEKPKKSAAPKVHAKKAKQEIKRAVKKEARPKMAAAPTRKKATVARNKEK